MAQALWTTLAEQDLEEIVFYIGVEQDRRRTARKIAAQLVEKCNLLASSPSMGTARSDLGENYRIFSHKRWLIVFREIPDGIEVMRIVDGARDFPRLFR